MIAAKKNFICQIQFTARELVYRDLVVSEIARITRESGGLLARTRDGYDHGYFVNIAIQAKSPGVFWRKMRFRLTRGPLAKVMRKMVIICEGQHGWDDYLLLHTFVKGAKLDKFSARFVRQRTQEAAKKPRRGGDGGR